MLPAAATAATAVLVAAAMRRSVPAVDLAFSSERIQTILPRLRLLRRGYRPPALVPFGLLQTAFADAFAPPAAAVADRFRRETLSLPPMSGPPQTRCCPDSVPAGDVSLDWLPPGAGGGDEATPICVLVPGLTGSSSSAYIQRAALALSDAGVRVACYNPRARGGNELRSPFFYSAGFTGDLRRALAHVRAAYPSASLTAAGFSLGANYLAKYVGEEGGACELSGAVAFACPLDCSAMSANLCRGSLLSRLLDRYVLVPSVQRVLETYRPALAGAPGLDLEGAARARSMAEFDGAVIAPMMGEASAAAYYAAASAARTLGDVRVPLLLVSAGNDVIAPAGILDRARFVEGGEAPLLLAVTAEGGHSMVWPSGWRGEGMWACDVLVEWVRAVTSERE